MISEPARLREGEYIIPPVDLDKYAELQAKLDILQEEYDELRRQIDE